MASLASSTPLAVSSLITRPSLSASSMASRIAFEPPSKTLIMPAPRAPNSLYAKSAFSVLLVMPAVTSATSAITSVTPLSVPSDFKTLMLYF